MEFQINSNFGYFKGKLLKHTSGGSLVYTDRASVNDDVNNSIIGAAINSLETLSSGIDSS